MLDDQTTLILAGFICALLPLLTWWLAPLDEPQPGNGWWQLGNLTAATGMILLGLRVWLPIWLGNHVTNTSFLIALMLWAQSLRTGLGRGWKPAHVAWACLGALAYYSATFAFVEVSVRIPLNRVVMGAMALYLAMLAWQLARRERSHSAMAMSACFVILGLGLWVTAWVVVQTPLSFTPKGVIQKIPGSPALLTLLTAAVCSFCYMGLMLEQSARRKMRALEAQAIAEENARLDAQLQNVDRQERLVLVAGSLAHELNQPLTAALTRTELVQALLQDARLTPDAITDQLDKAAASVGRTSDILGRIRAASQSKPPMLQPLDLREVVKASCELTGAEFVAHGVDIHVSLGEQALCCRGDAVLLSQVLANLLRNAAQAMGGAATKRIEVLAVSTDEQVKIRVRDHGPGVSEAVLQHLGQPFNGSREDGQGLGLGLAICLAIARQHGGNLDIENMPQGGAQAELSLPRLKEALP